MKSRLLKFILPFAFLGPVLVTSCGVPGDIKSNLDGEELKTYLNEKLKTNKFIAYKEAPSRFIEADAVPGKDNTIYLMYTGEEFDLNQAPISVWSSTLNVEHVWCQSRFRPYSLSPGKNDYDSIKEPTPYSDLYNLRPCNGVINEARLNYNFGENKDVANMVFSPFDPKYIPNEFFVESEITDDDGNHNTLIYVGKAGDETYRGEIARILFYVATRYDKISLTELGSGNDEIGHLDELLAWNLMYPPTERELRRNDAIYKIQGNRNVFVDHPDYACRIWQNTSDKTKAACSITK